jgi:hypothetical protein
MFCLCENKKLIRKELLEESLNVHTKTLATGVFLNNNSVLWFLFPSIIANTFSPGELAMLRF